jgi:outer membrane protein
MTKPRWLIVWWVAGLARCWMSTSAAANADPALAEETANVGDRPSQSSGSFYLRLGPGALVFDTAATVKSNGVEIPGATVHIDPDVTLITELGYRWQRVDISLTGGYPPTATVDGAGTLSSLGSLGRIRYGPIVLSVQYELPNVGRLHPYIGVGPTFLLIFKNEDDAVRHLDVHNSTGVALQLGAAYQLSPAWSLAIGVKKASLKTTATAVLDGQPIDADIRLDPTVIAGGLSFRF